MRLTPAEARALAPLLADHNRGIRRARRAAYEAHYCAAADCYRPADTTGHCRRHYAQKWRTARPGGTGPTTTQETT
jgi:hypothetical protein